MKEKNENGQIQIKIIESLNQLKKTTIKGTEYWLARDLQLLLGYSEWRNFKDTVEKARVAVENVGTDPRYHFGNTTTMMVLGKGAKRSVDDVMLTRLACYLVAMNGDSQKAEIAAAQTYFAIQSRKQEIQAENTDLENRILLRNRVKEHNKYLNSAAKDAGVKNYGIFHDAGYKGLYGGLSCAEIKALKGIDKKTDLLDCIDRAELAANDFRITQAESRLRVNNIRTEIEATVEHRQVGEEVRNTISRLGGTMPEKLPGVPPIKEIEKQRKKCQLPPSESS
ncbi:DNA damage-inducible protein D [Dehalogenimonas sp. THU2]|uniref:DNA damage-inducible protein D n=1 Tax=Dehalogenimonas sp. THU2 TaxID=3151121 RepID=UPI00321862FE